jgi:hypothetical protein
VPVFVKDSEVVAQKGGLPLAEDFVIDGEDVFLDGPVCRRLAVLDFDPEGGDLLPGARWVPPDAPDAPGHYELARGHDLSDPAFLQAAVFGGVMKTLATFEEPDTLGRRVDWAFDGPQLLVVPRAGDWANAFYERDSRSIQFFQFVPDGGARPVLTACSQDIIAHETAHAVIDGVAPDLYHAAHPQALAIHEAIADIATLLMAFRSRKLAARVLEQNGGSLDRPSAFTAVAQEFGRALRENRHALRNLLNETKLDPTSSDPHALSEVLSGALYAVMVRMYGSLRGAPAPESQRKIAAPAEYEQYSKDPATREPGGGSDDFRALFIASERFKRMVLRGLDYLPPGEVSFADFGRAVLASDQASHPDAEQPREWLVAELVARGVASAGDLAVTTDFELPGLAKIDLEELVTSDWLAYRFADKHRDALGIPKRIPFEVRPRLDVSKRYYHRDDQATTVRECLFKVSWSEVEPSAVSSLPPKRRLVRGTTLAIDFATRRVRALLTAEPAEQGRASRDALLSALALRGELAVGDAALAADGRPRRGVIPAELVDGVLRVRSTCRALHVTGGR